MTEAYVSVQSNIKLGNHFIVEATEWLSLFDVEAIYRLMLPVTSSCVHDSPVLLRLETYMASHSMGFAVGTQTPTCLLTWGSG